MALVNLWVTKDCNLRCRYCYEGREKNSECLDEKSIPYILSFIRNNCSMEELAINFHGGEPLLNFRGIKKIIACLSDDGIPVNYSMTTNLLLLTEETALDILRNNIYLSVSIDGIKEANDLNRKDHNDNGTYDRIVSNMELLAEKGIPYRTRMTVTENNARYLSESVKGLVALGCSNIVAAPDLFCKDWTHAKLKELGRQLEVVYDYVDTLDDVDFSFYHDHGKRIGKCYGGMNTYNVDVDGKLYPCTYVVGDEAYCIGDIYEGIIWDKLSGFMEIYGTDNENCSGCTNMPCCLSSRCKFLNKALTNEFCKGSEVICEIEHMMMNIRNE